MSTIDRFPLLNPSIPFEVKITDSLILKFMNLGNSYIKKLLYFFGSKGYEPEMLPIIFTLAKRVNCFLDVGANNGYFSLIVSALNRDCSVFAFATSPINIECCLHNIKINELNNCHLISKAISNYNGKIGLLNSDFDSSPTIVSSGINIGEKTSLR
ncbi:FkbM family methyltransferase [Bacteroidota bacterium]